MWVFHQQRPVSSFNLQICGFDFRSITLKLHAGLANKWELNHQKCNRRREYKLTLSNTGMEVTGLRMGTFAGHHGTLIYDNSWSRGLMVWNKQHEKHIKILDSVRERCCSCFGIWCSILRREPSPLEGIVPPGLKISIVSWFCVIHGTPLEYCFAKICALEPLVIEYSYGRVLFVDDLAQLSKPNITSEPN